MTEQPKLLSLATAVPGHVLRTDEVAKLARILFRDRQEEFERLLPIYDHCGIETRSSCVPLCWFAEPHGSAERASLYADNAVSLLEVAAVQCLRRAGVAPEAVDTLMIVSSSGIATPSLDARLMKRIGFRRNVQRVPVFGLGCAGGTLGLARAAQMARGAPGSMVLLLVVELCTLTFRAADPSNANVVATALFGDGAAATLLSTEGEGAAIDAWGEHCWPNTLDVMGWRIEDDGWGVVFSRDIPSLISSQFSPALDDFLASADVGRATIDHLVLHPGGVKVLQAYREALGLGRGDLGLETEILRQYGNMSAASVLFVLERHLARRSSGRTLMAALGPGFTAGFLLLWQS